MVRHILFVVILTIVSPAGNTITFAQELINKRIAITDAAFLNHDLPQAVSKLHALGFQSIAIHYGGPQPTNFPTLGFEKANADQREHIL